MDGIYESKYTRKDFKDLLPCPTTWKKAYWPLLARHYAVASALTPTNVCMYVCMYVCKNVIIYTMSTYIHIILPLREYLLLSHFWESSFPR